MKPDPCTDLKEKTLTTTTDLYGFAHYAHVDSPKDAVVDFLGDQAESFDVDGLTQAYVDAINAELDGTSIGLVGQHFFCDYPARSDATELIEVALENIDLGVLAADFDTTLEEQ